MRRLSIALLCLGALITGILLYQNRGSLPIDQLRQIIDQLRQIIDPLLEPLKPYIGDAGSIWQAIKDNPLSHGITTIATTAVASIIGKYFIDSIRQQTNSIISEKDKLLQNHTGEIATLETANKTLTDQMENARLKQKKAELQLEKAQATIAQRDEQILKEIQKRIASEQNLTQKTQDKIVEEIEHPTRKH